MIYTRYVQDWLFPFFFALLLLCKETLGVYSHYMTLQAYLRTQGLGKTFCMLLYSVKMGKSSKIKKVDQQPDSGFFDTQKCTRLWGVVVVMQPFPHLDRQ